MKVAKSLPSSVESTISDRISGATVKRKLNHVKQTFIVFSSHTFPHITLYIMLLRCSELAQIIMLSQTVSAGPKSPFISY